MRERLIQYVELLFAGAPGAEDMKQEILQNTLDRYDDLISQGKTEEAAYRLAISGIGDINELLNAHVQSPPAYSQEWPPAKGASKNGPKKKSRILVRVILISLLVLILASLLIVGLGIGIFSAYYTDTETRQNTQVQESGTTPAVGSGSTQATEAGTPGAPEAITSSISSIEIEWAAGNISIEPSEDVTTIQVQETEVADKYQMVCKVKGNTLSIRFSKESVKFPSFGVTNISKDLTITVPADWICRELDIDAAASNVTIRDLTIGELDFDGASGSCDLENCRVTSMDVDAAAGNLTFSGVLDNLDFDGASADCTLTFHECPKSIEVDGMSGRLDITLPSDCGFTVKSQGLTNDFSTDFDVSTNNGTHIHGDGRCLIHLEALSGDLNIHDGGYSCHDGEESHHANHH